MSSNAFHWDRGGVRPHPGLPGSCEYCNETLDPYREKLVEFVSELVVDELRGMGVDWDEDMEEKYGPYSTVTDRVIKILEELE